MSPEGAVGLPLCLCVPPHIWPPDCAVLGHWEEFGAKMRTISISETGKSWVNFQGHLWTTEP